MKTVTRLHVFVCVLACLLPASLAHFPQAYGYPWPHFGNSLYQPSALPTLAVIEENAFSMAEETAEVPLLLVPSNRLKVVRGSATYFSPTYYGIQEVSAIRLVLPEPMFVNHQAQMIEFPAGFTVMHNGYRVPMSVGVVLAPVVSVGYPQEIRVVYAVPNQPIIYREQQKPARKPIASTGSIRPQQPNSYIPPSNVYQPPNNAYQPSNNAYRPSNNAYQPSNNAYQPSNNAYRPSNNAYLPPPSNAYLPVSNPQKPTKPLAPVSGGVGPSSSEVGSSRPDRPMVTILDFPSSVSSPSVLFFQPPISPDSELGNREPPQAVVPAGIVQSTAPLPNLSLFINSKESSVLQTLRDEAQRNRLTASKNSFGDYEVIVN